MALVLDATVGGVASNSYLTLVEAQNYFDARLPLAGWDTAVDQTVLLVMATRVLDALAQPFKTFFPGPPAYYRVRRKWTGVVSTPTQKLAWPRIGMFTQNGVAIDPATIPSALKEATAELAGQLGTGDRTLDNDVIVQGLTAVRAGSVSLNFKDTIMPQVIPDAVYNLLPQSWLTDELYEMAMSAEFDIVSSGSGEPGQGSGW